MASLTRIDESLVERDEVLYPNTDVIDAEPLYKNFTTIQNVLRDKPIHSLNDKYRAVRVPIESYSTHQDSSKTTDGYIFNLVRIMEDIGYNPLSPFIHKYQRSAPMIEYNPINYINQKTTQKIDDYQSDIINHPSVSTEFEPKQMDEKRFNNYIQRMYGFDDIDTVSSVSSRRSSIDEKNAASDQHQSPSIQETPNNSKSKHQITIREYYPSKEISSLIVNRSLSSSSLSQQTYDDNEQILSEYEQFIHNHPELNNDSNPEFITQPNPEHITYKQNVSVRYLIPPTPPPPGPLIIREIISPRPPTPPPLIVKHQDPTPATSPPLILREAPPPPPPHQEATVVTKVLPPEPQSSPRVIIERNAPLPPKPQSIIIEKWLPYKLAPPREVIYERIMETPMISEFQPNFINNNQQRRHSADYQPQSSSRVPIPVHIERQNSFGHLKNIEPSTFDQFAWSTQQQISAMQQQTREQIQAHQQWMANQWQQHANMFMQNPTQLMTPTLIVNHPPVTITTNAYAQREDVRQQVLYQPMFINPFYT